MSATPTVSADSQTRPRIVIAGAGPAAQALVRELTRTPFAGGITVLSNRDDAPEELLELAALPQVSVRFGQPASYIDPDSRCVTTSDGLEFNYDQLVIATGSSPAGAPLAGEGRCLNYSTIDDAARLGEAVKDVTRVLGRRPLGILVGTGTAAGQAEAVLRARGVSPIRTTQRPASVVPTLAGSTLAAAGIVFEDGSSMAGDLVVLAE
ncbi:MAG TPA: FAD-dependent oxidoreductase, partial [Arthrobacter sp.]|nr:FAD-dependent oxidoreductase [Arthrobacter sp.]